MLAAVALVALLAAPQESWTLSGHLVSQEGDLLVDGWKVRCTAAGPSGQVVFKGSTAIDPATGTFQFEFRRGAHAFVSAHHPATGVSISSVECTPDAEGRASVTLFLEGASPADIAAFEIECPWLDAGLSLGSRALRVVGSLGDRPAVSRDRRRVGQHWTAALGGSGTYILEVSDPRFERVDGAPITRGRSTTIPLRGAASIDLVVRGANGDRLVDVDVVASVRVGEHGSASVPLALRSSATTSTRMHGLVPGDVVLRVAAAGHAPAEVQLEGLTRDDVREVAVQLEREACLRGRVVPAEGRGPLRGTTVVFALPMDADLDGVGWWDVLDAPVPRHPSLMWAPCGRDGTFLMREAAPGAYRIWCAPTPWTHVEVVGGEEPVALELPATGTLVGALQVGGRGWVVRPRRDVGPATRAAVDGRLPGSGSPRTFTFSSSTRPGEVGRWTGPAPAASPVDARFLASAGINEEGRFAILELPAGELELEVAPAPLRVGVPTILGATPSPLGSVEVVAGEIVRVVQRDGALEPVR